MYVWRTLPDGRIEIQGHGIATLTEPWQTTRAKKVWAKWGDLLTKEAQRVKVPRAWLLAIVAVESSGEADAEGADGEVGLFQLMPTWWGGRSAEQMKDPATNARAGADLVAMLNARELVAGDLPKLASEYNCGANKDGSPHTDVTSPWGMCAHGSYIDAITSTSNYAIASLGLAGDAPSPALPWPSTPASSSSSSSGGLLLAAAVAFAAWRVMR